LVFRERFRYRPSLGVQCFEFDLDGGCHFSAMRCAFQKHLILETHNLVSADPRNQ
jgi:hypothetical protein